MLLRELFDDDPVNIVDEMRTLMIDALTPLAASNVKFITIDQVIDRLREMRSGMNVDRALVMTILDPNKVKCVKKIEGDRILLSIPARDELAQTEEDEEAEKQKIRDKAQKQAQKQATASSDISKQARDNLTK